jgi:hypothetical protein
MLDDRAANEVIGFVLVFSLITATVGVVSVVGFDGLEQSRDAERVDNAERAFDVLADNVADIYYEDAPTRATEIKLSDAELLLASNPSPTELNVNVNGTQVPLVSPRPLIYRSETDSDSRVVYEAGAVFRVDGDSAVMLREPPMVLREGQSIVTLVTTQGDPGQAVGGTTTALVRAEELESETLYPSGGAGASVSDNVTISVQTTDARAPAWERYLESEVGWRDDACGLQGTNRVNCEFATDGLYVNDVAIEFTLSG